MSILTEREEKLLKRLQQDNIWTALLDKLAEFGELPRFRPSGDSEQGQRWIYQSGKRDGRLDILGFLSMKPIEREDND